MGKKSLRILISIILTVVFLLPSFTCLASKVNRDIFSNEKITDYKDEYEQMNLQTLDEEYTGRGILEGIFISQRGWYMLVYTEAAQHHINIYDQGCKFVNHIVIRESGTLLAMFDESDNQIVLFPVRDHVLIKIDEKGKYLSAWSIEGTDLSNLVDYLSALNSFEIETAGNIYSFHEKNILSEDSQAFYVTNTRGERLYSYMPGIEFVNRDKILRIILLLFVGFPFLIYSLLKRRKR